MAAELLGSKWSTLADLTVADGTVEAYASSVVPGVSTLNNTVGHWCHFAMDGGTDADYTYDFDWPVKGDFTIVINPTAIDTDAATTIDVSVQGSVDGTNYADMHTDVLDGVAIDTLMKLGVYDYDAKGRMPFMRLELTAASNESDSTILIGIIPH